MRCVFLFVLAPFVRTIRAATCDGGAIGRCFLGFDFVFAQCFGTHVVRHVGYVVEAVARFGRRPCAG